jgi:rubredoxin
MGHTKLEIDVYSCDSCGWVGTQPRKVKVQALLANEMGQVRNGSRGGQLWHRFECPLCHTPIKPSSPVDLLQVAAIEERKRAPANDNEE